MLCDSGQARETLHSKTTEIMFAETDLVSANVQYKISELYWNPKRQIGAFLLVTHICAKGKDS